MIEKFRAKKLSPTMWVLTASQGIGPRPSGRIITTARTLDALMDRPQVTSLRFAAEVRRSGALARARAH